ncbi:MAG: helicase-exonuclease AddAB subunit AddA [Clostridiales bacterium]|nr:helicase-exonuclease AddAB subunit AddA [Clostridiales bacterium]
MSQSDEKITETTEQKDAAQKMRWTPEQQKVIDLRDRSMLVSAAAGSGKTAVLVQRIISMITDREHTMDVDELLVVTFTNAAAAEMRERVLLAIDEALKADPADAHLMRQASLIHNARITTVDSFCLSVVSDHFHRIDLEPGFRIADEGELTLLREDVCDAVLEKFYQEKDPAFLKFVDGYSSAKSDKQIREMILKLFTYSQSYPWPGEWLGRCAVQYDAETVEELETFPWAADYLSYLHVRASEMTAQCRKIYESTLEDDGPMAYEGVIKDDLRQLMALCECGHFKEWQQALAGFKFKSLPGTRQPNCSEEKKTRAKAARDSIKKQINALRDKDFALDTDEQIGILGKTGEAARMLVILTEEFSAEFAGAKRKKNIIDFPDLEHFALEILVDPETKEPTEVAVEYRQKFREVMIDEYQDSNYVQEAILTAVSGIPEGRENLFMVGDVKQSIYRFRLARPELFVSKYKTFSPEENKKQRIDLHRNFRSRGEVLEPVNDIFARIMGKDLGNVEYDPDAALRQGREFDEAADCGAEFIEVETDPSGEDRKEAEGRVIARRIRDMIENDEFPGRTYGDVVILLRSLGDTSHAFVTAFEEEGVPLIVESKTGYFSAGEVQTVLSLLRVLDNPRQDIPLAAVMRSPLGGFTDEEMAQIRAAGENVPFYQCVIDAARQKDKLSPELAEKLRDFFQIIEDYRDRIPFTPIHELLQQIYDESGYRDYVTAMPAGSQRRANLDMLLEKAAAYEKTSYQGLYHFVRYIDRLIKYEVDFGEAESSGEHGNAVRLMTIHKSKGLEFPVVFVAGMGRNFNRMDERASMVFHPEYGVGLKYCDPERRISSDTLIRRIFSLEVQKENMGEELRILYVAMTRAKEKLVLVGAKPKVEPQIIRGMAPYEKLDFSRRMDASGYWDWVKPALLSYGNKYRIRNVGPDEAAAAGAGHSIKTAIARESLAVQMEIFDDETEKAFDDISRQFAWKYPYQDGALKQKVSVSEIKHRAMTENRTVEDDAEGAELFPEEIPVPYIPKFIRESEENMGALRGTAVHRLMECLDFADLPELSGWKEGEPYLSGLMTRLQESGRMSADEIGLINIYQIYRFISSPVAKRMGECAAKGKLIKEQPFVMSLPAREIRPDADSGEKVLIQGIIDVFWEEDDGIVLLDYKTDRVDTAGELVRRYEAQLKLYAEALSRRFTDKKVKEVLIYSFCLDRIISMENGL